MGCAASGPFLPPELLSPHNLQVENLSPALDLFSGKLLRGFDGFRRTLSFFPTREVKHFFPHQVTDL